MGITVRHDVAGILPKKDKSSFSAGMDMVKQQQASDNAMRLAQMQPLKYGNVGIGIGEQKRKPKPDIVSGQAFGVDTVLMQQPSTPSWQQRNQDIMSNIQAGMYDVATTRALSDIVNRQNRLMTNQRLSDAQKQDAFNQFEMDKDKMEVALGGFSIGPAMRSNQQSATPTFEQYYKPNRKEFRTDYASAEAKLVESGNPSPSSDEVIAKMRQDYNSWADLGRPMEGRATGGVVRPGEDYLVGERGPEVLRMGENGGYVIPNDQLAFPNQQQGTPINPERQVGNYGGPTTFGVPATLMAGPTNLAQPSPQASAPAQQPAPTQKRPPRKQPIYFNPGSNSVTNTGRSPIYNDAGNFLGDPSLYDAEGAQNIRQQAGGLSPQPGLRTWTSKDGKYSTEGEMIGFRATQGGDPLTSEMVRIRKKDGVEVDVPLHRLSEEDRQMVMLSPQYDYQIRNQRMGGANQQMFNPNSMEYSPTGSNYQQMFDPNNQEYAAMRAPNQQQEQNSGRFVGQYGMGGVDYGMNPATGNRVTASVRPGGTMLQYDEPVKVHPKATNKSIDEAMTRAGRARRQQTSEEFDRQFPNAIGNPVNIPNNAVTQPSMPSAPQGSPSANKWDPNLPLVRQALGVLSKPHSQQQRDAAFRTLRNFNAPDDVLRNLPDNIMVPDENTSFMGRDTGGGWKPGGWGDVPPAAKPKTPEKKLPERQNPQQIAEMQAYLQSGKASDAERQIIEDIFKAEGVDVNAAVPQQPQTSSSQTSPSRKDLIAQQHPQQPAVPPSKQNQADWNNWWRNNQAAYQAPKNQKASMSTLTSRDGNKTIKGTVELISNPIEEIGGQRVITFKREDGVVVNFYSGQLSEDDQSRLMSMAEISKKGYSVNSDSEEKKPKMKPEEPKPQRMDGINRGRQGSRYSRERKTS